MDLNVQHSSCMDNFIKSDDKMINVEYIRWVKKFAECMEVCQKSDGCVMFRDTHRVCRETSPISYNILNQLFDKHK